MSDGFLMIFGGVMLTCYLLGVLVGWVCGQLWTSGRFLQRDRALVAAVHERVRQIEGAAR